MTADGWAQAQFQFDQWPDPRANPDARGAPRRLGDALQEGGMSLASHSVTHPDFGRLEPGEARRELEVSRERLHRVLGLETREFAIPLGQSGNWGPAAALAAAEAGYTSVYAQCVNPRPEGTIARTFITRIDRPMLFRAALAGAYDNWEEWY